MHRGPRDKVCSVKSETQMESSLLKSPKAARLAHRSDMEGMITAPEWLPFLIWLGLVYLLRQGLYKALSIPALTV